MIQTLIVRLFGEAAGRVVTALLEGARQWWRDRKLIELGQQRQIDEEQQHELEDIGVAKRARDALAGMGPDERQRVRDRFTRE